MGRVLFLVVFATFAVFYYYFFGPAPSPSELGELPWWRPRGWVTRWSSLSGLRDLARGEGPGRFVPVLIAWLPPLLLTAGGFRLFTHPPLRVAFVATCLTLCAFAGYGYLSPGIWKFFSWRWPAVSASMGLLIACMALAPSLVLAARTQPPLVRAAVTLLAVAAVYLLSTEITGTNPELFGNISPWPVLTFFGFLLFGYVFAALHASTGAGIWLGARVGGTPGGLVAILGAGLCAAALSFAVFQDPGAGLSFGLGIVAALYAWTSRRGRDANSARALAVAQLAAAVLIAGSVWVGDWRAGATQAEIRNEKAAEIIAALEAYKGEHAGYPDRLEELIPAQLASLPAPRIGIFEHDHETFIFSNYGDSYALEFASALWDQCQYSPPYLYEDEEEYEDEEPEDEEPEDESLEGSWSCGSAPPKLW